MKISQLIFRYRRWILILIFILGFWSPVERMGGSRPGTTWLYLSGLLARYGVLPIAYSSIAVMATAILLAVLAASLRTWGAAYIGRGVVQAAALHGERIIAAGPYRYVRNPLYVGLWLHTLALSILMPPGGALFAVVAVSGVIAVLVRAEEGFLSGKQGEIYGAYMQQVPRFFCSLRPRLPASDEKAHWGDGFLGELYMWGVVITYALFASRYNLTLLEQGILVSLGVSIVIRGIVQPRANRE